METAPAAQAPTSAAQGSLSGLRIRWDRTLIFLAGALLLFTAIVTGVMAPFTPVTWAAPLVMALVGFGCVAGLRYLAVEERRAPAIGRDRQTAVEQPEQKLFDNEDEVRQEEQDRERRATAALDIPEHVAEPHEAAITQQPAKTHEPVYTVDELRAEALKVARSAAPTGGAWQPVPVPMPLYTQAPVVTPRAPEPLQVPKRPAATTATLKDAVAVGSQESTALNLDDVLKRRRA